MNSLFPSRGREITVSLTLTIALLLLCCPLVTGQSAQPYMMPPKAVADLIDAPYTPVASMSPDNEWMLLLDRPGLPSIEEVSQPELRLAGSRINPRTNGPSRGWYYNGLTIRKISDGSEKQVTGLPDRPRISDVGWSADGKYVSFVVTTADALELWLLDMKTAAANRLADVILNGASGNIYEWVSDKHILIAKIIPPDRGAPPTESLVPSGPVVQENIGRKAPTRTYQDLLENPYDEALFEYYMTSQLVRITLEGEVTPLGEPALISFAGPSPDGEYLLVETTHRPYSYTVPASRFPLKSEVWDMNGKPVFEIVDQPLADQIPIAYGSVRTGRREIGWRADADATLCWAEAMDGGDAGAEAEQRDRIFMLKAPFDEAPTPLITLALRCGGVTWGSDNTALVDEWWWKTRRERVWAVAPGKPEAAPRLIHDYSWEDRYNDPGTPMTQRTDRNTWVLQTADKGRKLFYRGNGASPEGDRPFLDELDLKTGKTERLFRSSEPYYESPVRLIDARKGLLVTRRESVSEPPNYFLRDLKTGQIDQLTFFPHPTPQLADVQKELIRYERADGLQLTGTLYLPPGYSPDDGPLPMVMWAYPEEYKSADAAGQVKDSPYRFVRVGWWSPVIFLMQGYAVLDDPSMPVVGEGDVEPNDSFIEQLVSSAQAAVDEVVRRGVADPDRIAIGGHSYGAFMTANLLAYSDLFRAGLARSGAYNRTLTPFGFQSEDRTFWEAPEVYFTMSPFMHADKIDEPILLVHGDADNNSGTYPLQSERFFDALKGLGATVRLVMLPSESHSYQARESVMHLLWETCRWLDQYVKNAPPRESAEPVGSDG